MRRYADSAQQDVFCAGTDCTVTRIVDQSPNGNHLDVFPQGWNGHLTPKDSGVLRKCQLLHPATPYYPFPRGKFHTRGNIWSFTVG